MFHRIKGTNHSAKTVAEQIKLFLWQVCHLRPFVDTADEEVKCALEVRKLNALRSTRASETDHVYRIQIEVTAQVAHHLSELGTSSHVPMNEHHIR